jgi:hypothetical protein
MRGCTRGLLAAIAFAGFAAPRLPPVWLSPVGAVRAAEPDEIFLPPQWLQQRISVADAERMYTPVADDRADRAPELRKPFGFRNAQWEKLKAQMQPGDEIWTFSSPAQSWQDLAGRSGVVLVRDKKIIAEIVVMMN